MSWAMPCTVYARRLASASSPGRGRWFPGQAVWSRTSWNFPAWLSRSMPLSRRCLLGWPSTILEPRARELRDWGRRPSTKLRCWTSLWSGAARAGIFRWHSSTCCCIRKKLPTSLGSTTTCRLKNFIANAWRNTRSLSSSKTPTPVPPGITWSSAMMLDTMATAGATCTPRTLLQLSWLTPKAQCHQKLERNYGTKFWDRVRRGLGAKCCAGFSVASRLPMPGAGEWASPSETSSCCSQIEISNVSSIFPLNNNNM
mmetsp:Transcript_77081/g.160440  ORF Transcript_77081/g.160440 Transcript_77081/m.160440 type:complete len:256 (-) Transcript_77081:2-769(-)